jgi:hypothetical protein
MAQIGSLTTKKLLGVMAGKDGLPAAQILAQNVAPELAERSTASKYPLVYVYCTKIVNQLREKFRTFSGEAQMVVEARVSNDRLEEMEDLLQGYIDAITQVLDQSRGDWGDGVFYCGGYEVVFGGVKHGGRNFMQIAKVSLILEISTD